MSLCDKLLVAKKDEEGGVTEYSELKKIVDPMHREYAEAVENIISDEKNHLNKVTEMIKYFECPDIKTKSRKRK